MGKIWQKGEKNLADKLKKKKIGTKIERNWHKNGNMTAI